MANLARTSLVSGKVYKAQRDEVDVDILGGGTHEALSPRRPERRSGV
jgi:hypothetical protein